MESGFLINYGLHLSKVQEYRQENIHSQVCFYMIINIFKNLNFHSSSKKSKSMQRFRSTMLWHFCTNTCNWKTFLTKKVGFSSIVKVPFCKHFHGMTQCLPNPGFMSIKVQNVDFLKKAFRRKYFFLFPYVLLICYHHLGTKLGMYIALCIFLNFWQVCKLTNAHFFKMNS